MVQLFIARDGGKTRSNRVFAMADNIPRRYDIKTDEMVPVTQDDWDSAIKHIFKQYAELERLRPKPMDKAG